jgi:hypothetical protein
MRQWGAFYQAFASVVCRTLVALVDVRVRKRVRRLSPEERSLVRSLVKPGDILVDSNDAFPGWQLLSKVFLRSEWVHMALYVGDGIVLDAGHKSHVAEISLERFLRTSHLAILRPHYSGDDDAQNVIACAKKYLGKPYNRALNLASTDDVYCTQLMREALMQMENPIEVRSTNVLGRHIVSPDAFIFNQRITVVFKTRLSAVLASMADQAA